MKATLIFWGDLLEEYPNMPFHIDQDNFGEYHFPLNPFVLLPIGTEIVMGSDSMVTFNVVRHFVYPEDNLLSMYVKVDLCGTEMTPEELTTYINKAWLKREKALEWARLP